jgi:hypothetical protein
MVIKLSCSEEETRSENVELSAGKDSVEILYSEAVNLVFAMVHTNLIEVTQLALKEEEKEALGVES